MMSLKQFQTGFLEQHNKPLNNKLAMCPCHLGDTATAQIEVLII